MAAEVQTPATGEQRPAEPGTKSPEAPVAATDLGAEPPEAAAAAAPAAAEYHGAPSDDSGYTFTLPDGYVADEKLAAEFKPIARELDLSPKGAQRLAEFKVQLDQRQREVWGEHLVELKTRAQADPEIGGPKYQPAVQAGIGTIRKFGTPAFRQMLNDYGVGAHPEMIRFLGKVASATGETPSLTGGDGQGVNPNRPLHEILYAKKE